MSEQIQIEIKDKIDSSIEDRIVGIGNASKVAHEHIERLKNALKAIDSKALNALTASYSRAQKAINDAAASSSRLAAQEQRTSAATIAAATAQQKLQTAATQTAAAQQALAASTARANAAQSQTVTAAANAEAAQSRAAQAALRLQSAQAKAAEGGGAMAREAEKLKRELFPLYAAQQQYNEAVLRTNALIAKGAIDIKTYDASIARATSTLERAKASHAAAASGANNLINAQNKLTNSLANSNAAFTNYIRNVGRAAAAGLGATAITRASDAYTTLQNKLQVVAESQAQVNDLTEKLFNLANRTLTPIDETVTAFTRFDRALALLGASQTETLRLTETVNKMLTVSGATAGEAASGLLQLSQAFNKGKLDGDEFRTVMELMPSVADAIAKQMGVTRGELLKLAPQGKITAEIMRKAFAETADDIDKKFAKTIPTIGQSLTVFFNNFKKAIGEFNKSTGFFDAISSGIIFVSKHLKEIGVALVAVGTGLAIAFAPTIVAGIMAAATAMKAFTLALLANPVVLLASALAGLIAYLVTFRNESDLAREAIDNIGFGLDALVGTIKGVGVFIGRFFAQVIDVSVNAFKAGYNAVVAFMEKTTNFILNGINYLREKAGQKPLELVSFDRLETQGAEWKDVGELWADSLNEGFELQGGAFQKMLNGEATKKLEAAAARVAVAKTGGGEGEEKRAATLAKINLQLDNEIARLGQLQPLREKQAKFDAIEEQLLGKKIKLTAEESESIKAKIDAIENGKVVQAEMDRIYEDSIGTLRTYNAVQDATSELLKIGAISVEDAARAITAAREAYANSIDPLREYNKEIDQQMELLSMLPREREVAQQMQQIENELLAAGTVLTNEQTEALKLRLQALQASNIASQAEAAIWENSVGAREAMIADLQAIAKLKATGAITSGDATNAVTGLLPEGLLDGTQQQIEAEMEALQQRQDMIDEMHKLGLLKEDAYNAAVLKMNADRFALQTKNFQSFTGALAGLMSSGNKKLFKIGQAAAIAEAAVSGAQAIMNAMAVKPWYVGAALAVTQAVKSAQTIAQIKNAKPPGFIAGGFTGNMPTTAEAGVVHGKEFVMNAASTSRIGVGNLERLQSGAASVQSGSSGGGLKVSINNYGTSKQFETQQISPDEVRIIARDEVGKTAPKVIASQIAESNSPVSKSLSNHTLAARRR